MPRGVWVFAVFLRQGERIAVAATMHVFPLPVSFGVFTNPVMCPCYNSDIIFQSLNLISGIVVIVIPTQFRPMLFDS